MVRLELSYFEIMIPVLSLFFSVFVQIFAFKFVLKNRLLKSEYFACLCGLIFLIACEVYIRDGLFREWLFLALVNLAIYACLSYCYFAFITMGETARRVRLLCELYDAPEGLTKEEILKRYGAREVIDLRLKRLLSNGQIILRDGRFYIGKPTVLFISKTIVFLKFVILGRKNEFEKRKGDTR